MSYCCQISFKQISGNKVYSFLQTFKKEVMEHLKEIAENNFSFSPILRSWSPSSGDIELTKELRSEVQDWAIQNVFRHRFFYDEKLQLLGVYAVHESVQNLFDCTVHFQNSCDQDYEYETWQGVRYFEDVAEKWKKETDKKVKEKFKEEYEYEWNKGRCSELDYYRRSFAYEEIWENFEDTLFDDDSVVYLTLFGPSDYQPLKTFVRFVMEKTKEWVEEIKQGKF